MQWSRANSARGALIAAVLIGSMSMHTSAARGAIFAAETVYAFDVTPVPAPIPNGAQSGLAAPTPIGQQPGFPATPAALSPVGSPVDVAPTPAPQPISDQIATVAQQVAQIAQDPTMSVDSKTTQINALASLFNQLVAQWQQQNFPSGPGLPGSSPACPAPCTQPSTNAVTTPTPVGSHTLPSSSTTTDSTQPPSTSPANVNSNPGVSATPTPAASPSLASPVTQTTADLLRAQIANVAQQMAAISQDSSLPSELKTARLNSLSSQFNELMSQLQLQAP